MDWKDTTSYSRGDTVRKPTTWSCDVGSLEVTVTCGHIHYRPNWVMHCHKLGVDTKPLGLAEEIGPEEAQRKAIERLKEIVAEWQRDLEKA